MPFTSVVGQKAIQQRLLADIAAARVPHALMLCGPEGAGKLALAIGLARALLCQQPHADGSPCGECLSCRMAAKLEHPDLHFSFPIITGTRAAQAKDAISDVYLKEWRQRVLASPYFDLEEWIEDMGGGTKQAKYYVAESDNLQRKLVLKSNQGGRKVVVMWLPEKLGDEAANKLLKLFEEPPALTHFIMVSEAPELVLGTIVSRTQRIQVPPLSRAELQQTRPPKDESQHLELFISLMRLAYQRNVKQLRAWADQVAALGRDQQKAFLAYCQRQLRDNFIYNFHQPELCDQTPDEAAFSKNFARFINEWNVCGIMDELSAAAIDVEQNTNSRMVFFDLALKMIVLIITPATQKPQ